MKINKPDKQGLIEYFKRRFRSCRCPLCGTSQDEIKHFMDKARANRIEMYKKIISPMYLENFDGKHWNTETLFEVYKRVFEFKMKKGTKGTK